MQREKQVLHELFDSPKRRLVDQELERVIRASASSDLLIDDLLYHLRLDTGRPEPTLGYSKRLRAYLCLLLAEEQGHDLELALPSAVTVELIHNATLIVDDVQDGDTQRCGRLALWQKTSVAEAMNAAFFLVCTAQAYYHGKAAELHLLDLGDEIVSAFNSLISGQQRDISFHRMHDRGVAGYERMVDGKTGALLYLSCLMGCCPRMGTDIPHRDLLHDFAINLSRMHQLQDDFDDLLSLTASSGDTITIPRASIVAYYLGLNTSSRHIPKDDLSPLLERAVSYSTDLEANLRDSLSALYEHGLLRTDSLPGLVSVLSRRNTQQVELRSC